MKRTITKTDLQKERAILTRLKSQYGVYIAQIKARIAQIDSEVDNDGKSN